MCYFYSAFVNIYSFVLHSSCTNIQVAPSFWQAWKEFEIKHGNEDTVREMLRIKRSVQATYNTQVNFMSSQMLAAQSAAKMEAQGKSRLHRPF